MIGSLFTWPFDVPWPGIQTLPGSSIKPGTVPQKIVTCSRGDADPRVCIVILLLVLSRNTIQHLHLPQKLSIINSVSNSQRAELPVLHPGLFLLRAHLNLAVMGY